MVNILLIEPDAILAGQYKSALSGAGFRVRRSVSAQDAVILADRSRPDIVILEPMLAGHSGIEFLYEFRSYPEWQTVPVIILSRSRADELDFGDDSINELGIVQVLYKPEVSLKRLTQIVSRIVNR